MRRLRIAIVIESFLERGGVELRTRELVKGLLVGGHDAHIYANRWSPDEPLQVTMHRVPMVRLIREAAPVIFARLCASLLSKEQYDIIHTQARIFRCDIATLGVGCHRAYLDALGAGGQASKSVFDRVILYLERSMLREDAFSQLIVNSRKCRDEFIHYYNVPAERITVVYNGVDAKFFAPVVDAAARDAARRDLCITPDDIVVVFVGSGFQRKGLDTLIDAIGRSKGASRVRALIAGRGKREPVEKLAERHGITDRITWLGESSNVRPLYTVADIFALPTRYDPFANSTMAGLASGIPVVTTTTNGVSEIMTDGETGFVVSPDDPDALAERLDLLAGDCALRARIGAKGRESVLPYTWDRTTASTISVYESVMSERGKL